VAIFTDGSSLERRTLVGLAQLAGLAWTRIFFSFYLGCVITSPISLRVIYGFLSGIFHIAPGLLHFAFCLFRGTANLSLFTAGPLTRLALNAASYIFDLAFHLIFIHDVFSFWGYGLSNLAAPRRPKSIQPPRQSAGLRPWIKRINTATTASTNKM
jgi:hypothetical protein